MFVKPSELPWWAWLGGALCFAVVGRFALVGFTAGGGVLLLGIYVVFPRNVGTIRAELPHDGWTSNPPIVLSRRGTSVIDISSKLERKPQ